jgi:hypothetical protein
MLKEYKGREQINISLAGMWPPGREVSYVLEGALMVHFIKRWDAEEEEWRTLIVGWEDVDWLRVGFADGSLHEVGAWELPHEVGEEIECLIGRIFN